MKESSNRQERPKKAAPADSIELKRRKYPGMTDREINQFERRKAKFAARKQGLDERRLKLAVKKQRDAELAHEDKCDRCKRGLDDCKCDEETPAYMEELKPKNEMGYVANPFAFFGVGVMMMLQMVEAPIGIYDGGKRAIRKVMGS